MRRFYLGPEYEFPVYEYVYDLSVNLTMDIGVIHDCIPTFQNVYGNYSGGKNITSCTQMLSTRYPITFKVYIGYHGISEIEHGWSACTVDNPPAKSSELSLRTGG